MFGFRWIEYCSVLVWWLTCLGVMIDVWYLFFYVPNPPDYIYIIYNLIYSLIYSNINQHIHNFWLGLIFPIFLWYDINHIYFDILFGFFFSNIQIDCDMISTTSRMMSSSRVLTFYPRSNRGLIFVTKPSRKQNLFFPK